MRKTDYTFNLKLLWLLVTLFIMSNNLTSQEVAYSFSAAEVSIDGASTLHAWKVEAPDVSGYPEAINFDATGEGTIEEFGFQVDVATMDGGRGSSMNNKIYKALKSDAHPQVSYTQDEVATYASDGTMTSIGTLEMAGVSKSVSVDVVTTIDGDKITFTASYPMKLTDFDIEPPSAMFGQIVTKDDIVVNFQFVYQK